jgi:hypothetical protein
MKINIGSTDRTIRIILGLVIIAAGVVYHSWWGAIGAIPVLIAIVGWCPPYAMLGINTSKKKHV